MAYVKKEKKFNLILPEGDDKDSYTLSDLATILQVPAPSVQRYKMFLMSSGITTFPGGKGGRKAGGAGSALKYTPEQKNMFIELVEFMNQGHTCKQAAEKVAAKVTAEKPVETPAQPAKVDNLPNVIKEEDKQLLKHVSSKYKFGDVMEGVVTSIESYGVFINDGPYVRGLIHISNIKDGIVTDPNKYFTVGQRINAKVLQVKHDGKLSLSTKHLSKTELENAKMAALVVEPSSINTINMPVNTSLKLAEMKSQLMQKPASEETKQMATNQTIKAAPAPIMKDVQEVLKGKVGIISTAAEKRFTELFEKYGTVPFLMQLGAVSSTFEIDLGLLLAKELEQKLQCL